MEQQAQRLKRKRRGLLRRLTVFGVIVLMFAVLVTSALWSQSSSLKEKKEEKKVALEKELKQLQTKQEDISDEIKKLKSKEYVLELARRDYYMSKKGEKIFDVGNKSD
ncbi:cell division protein DivIC [Bacillus safensis]|uniref:Cell division protein DivIC n=1 Tax=Bacillus safensis TaxID=561879 RepID=A0A5S9M0I4_BACIA|nr:cell division protein DivIC [Bacillus safensis]